MKITIKDLYDFEKETGLVSDGKISVKTKDGNKIIEDVDITLKDSKKIKIDTTNFSIVVSPNHLLFKEVWIKTRLLKIGDFIDTINGYEEIVNITKDNITEDLYDIQVSNQEYYANGIRSHNSTIKQSLELCIFGKVQGKSGKRLALTKLPNRRNGNLYTGVFFKNQTKDDIVMKRFIQPNNFEMFVNEEPFTQRFKTMSDKEREKIVGYNFEIFKSFISLNMNDFKNFISLTKEDKENLLNKLFNLNELDVLFSITKDLDNANKKLISDLDSDIYTNEQNILEYKQAITNIKKTQQISSAVRISDLKQLILSKKPIYKELEVNIKKCDEDREKSNRKMGKLNKMKSDKNRENTRHEVEVESIEEKINLYKNGICPTCNSDLTGDEYKSHLEVLESKLEEKTHLIIECEKYLNRCTLEDIKIRNNNDLIYKRKNTYQSEKDELMILLSTMNKEYSELLNSTKTVGFESLEIKVKELKEQNNQKRELLKQLTKKSDNYDKLKSMFSFDGIRKSMIKNALIPINIHLKSFLEKLNSEYNAELNENFDANIMELGILNIDPETLSKGEDKKINIAIALSYLKMVLELKHSNIMFLDEIFDGIDVGNINLTLKVLKEIAIEHKINIIIVNHGTEQITDISIFDKVIRANKEIFSNLENIS